MLTCRRVNWSNKFHILIALLLGGISVLAFAPVGWHWLMPLSLAGLLALLHGKTPRRGFTLGWWFGLGMFGAGVSWVYVSLTVYGGMPTWLGALATLLFCGFLALFPALATWLTVKLTQTAPLRWLLVFPAAWTLIEWVRGWILTGFPWLAAGYAQVPDAPLAGYAPILGVYGLSWLTAVCAGALVWLLRDIWLPGKWLAPFALLTGLLGAGEALKKIDWTQPVGAPLPVALLQGNVPQEMKWRPEKAAQTLLAYADQIVEAMDRQGDGQGDRQAAAQLVVLPETAFPRFYDDLPVNYRNALQTYARDRGADILFGVPTGDIDGDYYNSVASLGASPTQFYHKQHLVVFGEFVPPGFGWIVEVLHIPLSDFARGQKYQAPLNLAGQSVAVNICYEDVFGEEIIRALPQATLLVNVSNLAWFGESFASWQHAQMSQMRALETGRYMLRATNTGVTAIIDEKGHVLASLPEFTRGILRGQAQGFAGVTPYVRWGNWPVVGLVLVLLVWAGWRYRPR